MSTNRTAKINNIVAVFVALSSAYVYFAEIYNGLVYFIMLMALGYVVVSKKANIIFRIASEILFYIIISNVIYAALYLMVNKLNPHKNNIVFYYIAGGTILSSFIRIILVDTSFIEEITKYNFSILLVSIGITILIRWMYKIDKTAVEDARKMREIYDKEESKTKLDLENKLEIDKNDKKTNEANDRPSPEEGYF